MDTSSWFGLFVQLFATPKLIGIYLAGINWYAFGLAVVAPALMLIARQEIRLRRLRAISDFLTSFRLPGLDKTTVSTAPRLTEDLSDNANVVGATNPASKEEENPSFEYVKSKYISDLTVKRGSIEELRINTATSDFQRINIYIEIASRPFANIPYRLLLAAAGFALLSYYGFAAFLAAFGYGGSSATCLPATGCGLSLSEAVGAFTFAGAYIAALRMLLRNLAVFDLAAYSFVRQSAEIVASVLIVVLLFNALPRIDIDGAASAVKDVFTKNEGSTDNQSPSASADDGADKTTAAANKPDAATSPQAPCQCVPAGTTASTQPATVNSPSDSDAPVNRISWVWLLLAPALGLLPRSATQFTFVKTKSLINWTKTTDERFLPMTRVTSLDGIDGIDFETRFRLEECGIYDMQNLATYNPIMLFIETPYGIFQCIDWVAQAQLCHIVGMEKFIIFRELNIRTIFDLERAIDSIDSPEAYDAICAAVLLAPTEVLRNVSKLTGFKFAVIDNGVAQMEDVDPYFNWLHNQMRTEDETTAAIEHLMNWISDDLHVRRLRRLWNDIAASLGGNSEYLKDSKRNPDNAARMEQLRQQKAEQAKAADQTPPQS